MVQTPVPQPQSEHPIREDRLHESDRQTRIPKFLVAFVMFTTGAAGLVFEYVLSTVTTYILGNAIEQFSMTIAVMMLFMGVAGVVQKSIQDQALIAAFAAAECLLALAGGFAPLILEFAFANFTDHFLLVHYTLAAAIGLLIGIEIPLILRINARWTPNLRANIATILTWDYVGAFLGALIWTFVLLRYFPITHISFIVAIFNLAVATIAIVAFATFRLVKHAKLVIALMLATLLLLAVGAVKVRELDLQLEQSLYSAPIAFSATTRYQHIVVTHQTALNDWRLYINGNLQFSSLDEARYHEMLVHPVMGVALQHSRVLILGGGDGLALRRVLEWDGVQKVLLVDIDPDMIKLARENSAISALNKGVFSDVRVLSESAPGISSGGMRPAKPGPRKKLAVPPVPVSIMNIDADIFLRDAEQSSWDVVIVDLPDPSSIELTKLYSLEFYEKIRRVLAPGGTVSVQSTSPYHAKEAFLTILRTVKAARFQILPYRINVPSFGDWGFTLAWVGRPENEIRERFIQSGLAATATFITPEIMRASLAFGRSELDSQFTDVNMMMRPVLLERYLQAAWAVE